MKDYDDDLKPVTGRGWVWLGEGVTWRFAVWKCQITHIVSLITYSSFFGGNARSSCHSQIYFQMKHEIMNSHLFITLVGSTVFWATICLMWDSGFKLSVHQNMQWKSYLTILSARFGRNGADRAGRLNFPGETFFRRWYVFIVGKILISDIQYFLEDNIC